MLGLVSFWPPHSPLPPLILLSLHFIDLSPQPFPSLPYPIYSSPYHCLSMVPSAFLLFDHNSPSHHFSIFPFSLCFSFRPFPFTNMTVALLFLLNKSLPCNFDSFRNSLVTYPRLTQPWALTLFKPVSRISLSKDSFLIRKGGTPRRFLFWLIQFLCC